MYLFIYIFLFLSFVLILLEMWPNVAIQFRLFLGGFRSGSGNPWPGEACLFGRWIFHAHLFLTDETCGLSETSTSAVHHLGPGTNGTADKSGVGLLHVSELTFSRGFWTPLSGEKVGKKRMKSRNWWKQSSIFSSGFLRYASPNEPLTSASNMNHRLTIGWNGCQCDTQRRHPFELCALQGATVDIVCCSTEGQVWHGAEFFEQIWVPHLSRIDTGWKILQRIFHEQKLCRFQFLFPLFEAATVRRFVPAPTSQSYFRLRRHKVFFGVPSWPRIHKFWFRDFLSTWTDGWIEDLNTFFIFVSYCVWGVINCVASACFVLGCWLIVVTNSEISAMSDLGSKQLLWTLNRD